MDNLEELARRCRAAWSEAYGSRIITPWERLSEPNKRAWLAVAKEALAAKGEHAG